MSTKAKSTSKSENSYESTVQASEFDATKFRINPVTPRKTIPGQKDTTPFWNAFPSYDYSKKGKKSSTSKVEGNWATPIIVTGPITLSKFGGFSTPDGSAYKMNENAVQNLSVPLLDEDEGGSELRDSVFIPLNEYLIKKINTDGNKDGFISKTNTDGKDPEPIKALNYESCLKTYIPGKNADNADTLDETTEGAFKHIKLKLRTEYDPEADPSKEKKITTIVYINDEDGNPKSQPEKADCMEDMRRLVPRGSIVRLAIGFNKMSIDKNVDKFKQRPCRLTAVVRQIYVVKAGEQSMSQDLTKFVFGKPSKPDSDEDDKSEDEKDDKSVASEKSEEVPKQTAKSSKVTKKVETEEEDEDEDEEESEEEETEEEEEEVPPPKKGGKTAAKPVKKK